MAPQGLAPELVLRAQRRVSPLPLEKLGVLVRRPAGQVAPMAKAPYAALPILLGVLLVHDFHLGLLVQYTLLHGDHFQFII